MSWETATSGRRYYTRSRKVSGHTIRTYHGMGDAGRCAALEDELRRATSASRRLALEALRQRRREADVAVGELVRFAELVASAVLLASGYHRPQRRKWRRWR